MTDYDSNQKQKAGMDQGGIGQDQSGKSFTDKTSQSFSQQKSDRDNQSSVYKQQGYGNNNPQGGNPGKTGSDDLSRKATAGWQEEGKERLGSTGNKERIKPSIDEE